MENRKETSAILFQECEGIGVITLNRAQALNTFREQDYQQLHDILISAVRSRTLRALVLIGKGDVFSAGQDLSELDASTITNPDIQQARLTLLQDITRLMISIKVPTIAAFNGYAVGFGIEISLACDIRIANPDCYFMFPESRRGLFQTNGVLWLLPRLVGLTHAKEMLLCGNKINAQRALQIGLISAIHPSEDLLSRTMAMANSLAANSGYSMALLKQCLNQTYDIPLEAMLALEMQSFVKVMAGQDFKEGITSFLEKRNPDYRAPNGRV